MSSEEKEASCRDACRSPPADDNFSDKKEKCSG